MKHRLERHLLLPLLVVGLALAVSVPAHAQYRQVQPSGGTSASLTISFGSTPHWSAIRGTRVQQVRERERPDYDMFRYGGSYYVFNNNQWYMSRRGRGEFRVIDERYVPREVSRVPRQHWRNYPSGWNDQQRDPRSHDSNNGNHGDGNNGYGNGNGGGRRK